jgi:RNA polymerase sigma-70 factor (ECF subfamily)
VSGPAKPTTWLAQIAVRVAATHRRSGRRRAALEQGPAGRDLSDRGVPGPEREHEDRRALEQVQAALAALDEQKRVVFVLFELEGETCEEIARALQIPVGTVYSRLHGARRQFQRALARLAGLERAPTPATAETA